MSLLDLNSLSGLATALTELNRDLAVLNPQHKGPISESLLNDLKKKINLLQVVCPNHPGVVEARAKWFEAVLEALRYEVTQLANQNAKVKMLETPLKSMVEHFLRRSYLKEYFAYWYRQVQAHYAAVAKAHPKEVLRQFYGNAAEALEAMLVAGRL